MDDVTPDAAPPTQDPSVARPFSPPRWKLAVTVVLAAVVVAAVVVAQSHGGRKLLTKAGVAPRPEPYTALSFTSPAKLGRTGLYGPSRVTVAFTIFNHQTTDSGGRSMSYTWQITAAHHLQASGTTTVPFGESARVSQPIHVACPVPQPRRPHHPRPRQTRRKVTVALPGVNESIDFWETCDG
jgi:hypothetical protein